MKLTAVSMLEQMRRKKKHHVLIPLLLTILGLLALIALVLGYLTITAGVFRPSWVAGMYPSPIPTRFILDAPAIDPSTLEKRLGDELAQEHALHPTSTTATIALSERDLTGLVKFASGQLAIRGVQLNKGQVVILPDHIELFAEVQKNGHVVDMIGSLVPRVSNGIASLEWTEAKIGSLSVSPAFAQSLIDRYVGPMASIHASFGNETLDSIHLENGNARLVFQKKK